MKLQLKISDDESSTRSSRPSALGAIASRATTEPGRRQVEEVAQIKNSLIVEELSFRPSRSTVGLAEDAIKGGRQGDWQERHDAKTGGKKDDTAAV